MSSGNSHVTHVDVHLSKINASMVAKSSSGAVASFFTMEEDELLPQKGVRRKWGEDFEGLFGVWLRHGSHPSHLCFVPGCNEAEDRRQP